MTDDVREVTEAAIEAVDRERVDPYVTFPPSESPYEERVAWRAGGVSYTVYVHRTRDHGLLKRYEDEESIAWRVELDALRTRMETEGLFDADVEVDLDKLEWFTAADEQFRADGTPKPEELVRLRQESPFEYCGEIDRPGVRAVVQELRKMYRNGTAIAGEFALGDDEVLQELWDRGGVRYTHRQFSLGNVFLQSDAVVEFMERATPADGAGEPTFEDAWLERGGGFLDEVEWDRYTFDRVPLTRLASDVADTLFVGGAYEQFTGSQEEALALGRASSTALRDGSWRSGGIYSADVAAFRGDFQWSDWFVLGERLDTTYLVEDRPAGRIRLLMATDID